MCPSCHGIGWQRREVPFGDPEFGRLVPCEACGHERRARWLEKFSRMSPDMMAWSLDGFRNRDGLNNVVSQLRQALQLGVGWVTLSGPPGTGKTYLLAALANEARLLDRPALYITMADLLSDLKDTFDPKSDTAFSALFQEVMEADVLCLDEVEKFYTTGWAEEQFFRLVEHRYREWNEGLTVIATNRRIGLDKQILDSDRNPGYFESRIMDGRFMQLTDFWNVGDARPVLKRGK